MTSFCRGSPTLCMIMEQHQEGITHGWSYDNMKYYKNTNGEVYAYENEAERQEWGTPDLIEMSAAEIDEHLNPTPTTEQLAEEARAKRDSLINGFIWRINRHRDELDLGLEPTEPLEPLLQYVQALRDVSTQANFPQEIVFPIEPELPQ